MKKEILLEVNRFREIIGLKSIISEGVPFVGSLGKALLKTTDNELIALAKQELESYAKTAGKSVDDVYDDLLSELSSAKGDDALNSVIEKYFKDTAEDTFSNAFELIAKNAPDEFSDIALSANFSQRQRDVFNKVINSTGVKDIQVKQQIDFLDARIKTMRESNDPALIEMADAIESSDLYKQLNGKYDEVVSKTKEAGEKAAKESEERVMMSNVKLTDEERIFLEGMYKDKKYVMPSDEVLDGIVKELKKANPKLNTTPSGLYDEIIKKLPPEKRKSFMEKMNQYIKGMGGTVESTGELAGKTVEGAKKATRFKVFGISVGSLIAIYLLISWNGGLKETIHDLKMLFTTDENADLFEKKLGARYSDLDPKLREIVSMNYEAKEMYSNSPTKSKIKGFQKDEDMGEFIVELEDGTKDVYDISTGTKKGGTPAPAPAPAPAPQQDEMKEFEAYVKQLWGAASQPTDTYYKQGDEFIASDGLKIFRFVKDGNSFKQIN